MLDYAVVDDLVHVHGAEHVGEHARVAAEAGVGVGDGELLGRRAFVRADDAYGLTRVLRGVHHLEDGAAGTTVNGNWSRSMRAVGRC
jgi:hypothetical protein